MTVRRAVCRLAIVTLAAATVAIPQVARANRCSSGTLSGGAHCGCPDPAELVARCNDVSEAGHPPGTWTAVVYDLDKTFPPDGTTSFVTVRAHPKSPCAAMGGGSGEKTVPITGGYVVGCWSEPDQNGCRTVHVLNDASMCLEIASTPFGPGCSTPECDAVETGQTAISNAGAADRFVCPPIDPATSCRSTRRQDEELFRLWVGGLCATNSCEAGQVGANTCTSHWGATQWGYNRGHSKDLGPGWYDWQSGAFKIGYVGRRNSCGTFADCLGKDRWDQVLVGTPAAGYSPPCLGNESGVCDAAGCVP
jgi:hypothetical protein